MEFYVLGQARILYSSMMLKQMSSLVPELAQTEEDEFFVERDSETPARVGRGLSLRDMDAYADTKEAYEEEML